MGNGHGKGSHATTVGDLISVSRSPAVVCLREVERIRDRLCGPGAEEGALGDLLAGYHLGDPDTKAAFDVLLACLAGQGPGGGAFVVQGVYGAGKSHLLAVLALLCGHPEQAWPVFLSSHPEYKRHRTRFAAPKLVVTVPLDEHTPEGQSLEHIIFSSLEHELAHRHRVRVALTDRAHLLALVEKYVVPQARKALDEAAVRKAGQVWADLAERDRAEAARVALDFLDESGFPLNYRRSRAEAWAELRSALHAGGIDGPVLLLDELGVFLAARDRRMLNADASFLQYLAQRTAAERCWLVCVTQRGFAEVGDIDRRTLRQMRDRFRPALTLDLSALPWVLSHRLVERRDPAGLERLAAELCAAVGNGAPFAAEDIAQAYPLNPLALVALEAAAEDHLSRRRSIVRLLQEAAHHRGWLARPAWRLIAADDVFDLVSPELMDSPSGRQYLEVLRMAEGEAPRLLPGREAELLAVAKALMLASVGNLRWTAAELGASLLGSRHRALWAAAQEVEQVLSALYLAGLPVERAWREADGRHCYHVDVSSDTSARLRERMGELRRQLREGDTRVVRAALSACDQTELPLAGLLEPRPIAVEWYQTRRTVSVQCRDLAELSPPEMGNLVARLESPDTREHGVLVLALPLPDMGPQEAAWRHLSDDLGKRAVFPVLAWIPAALPVPEWQQLVDHAALGLIVSDATLGGRRGRELREEARRRQEESQAVVRGMISRAFRAGRIVDLCGEVMMGPERLLALSGDWPGTLVAALDGAWRARFPKFPSVAPERPLRSRGAINQVIAQFVCPGEVSLPPASALEGYLAAYAAPLGLVGEEGRKRRLALGNAELVETAMGLVPPLHPREEIAPQHIIATKHLIGRLGKSEWGLAEEQAELLIAALIRAGYLVALDAFLQPTRLELVSLPLSEGLPYVMRGRALTGAVADDARTLWQAAVGTGMRDWDLPGQEQAWRDLLSWGRRVRQLAPGWRAAIEQASSALGQAADEWAFARSALSRAEAVASALEEARTSWEGLRALVGAVRRLPGAVEETRKQLVVWRECESFLEDFLSPALSLFRLLSDPRLRCQDGSLLARQRQEVLLTFSVPQRLVSRPEQALRSAQRFFENYRRHYVAWHQEVHSRHRFASLVELRQSPRWHAVMRLAAAGLRAEEAGKMAQQVDGALALRCLVADPLPEGAVVCPGCEIELGQGPALPDVGHLEVALGKLYESQMADLRGQLPLLTRRLQGETAPRARGALERLLAAALKGAGEDSWELVSEALSDAEAAAWVRAQLGQPQAHRRALADLADRLRGRELTSREVIRRVNDWLAAGEDEVVEIV